MIVRDGTSSPTAGMSPHLSHDSFSSSGGHSGAGEMKERKVNGLFSTTVSEYKLRANCGYRGGDNLDNFSTLT